MTPWLLQVELARSLNALNPSLSLFVLLCESKLLRTCPMKRDEEVEQDQSKEYVAFYPSN